MKTILIDINCDLGEGIGNEKQIMPLISSCSIAAGAHAGCDRTIKEVALLAKQENVKVGVHPSYPDRTNFGRVTMEISKDVLIHSLKSQVDNFVSILNKENIKLHHIKAHGALYNDIATDIDLAQAFLTAIAHYKDVAYIYVPFNSVIEGIALVAGFKIKYEAFADRNYTYESLLVPRNKENALIQEPIEVLKHIARMVCEREVKLPSGKRIRMVADTYCIHGDTPAAVKILTYITDHQAMYNLQIK